MLVNAAPETQSMADVHAATASEFGCSRKHDNDSRFLAWWLLHYNTQRTTHASYSGYTDINLHMRD